jgi:hypothetical protein
MNTNDDTADPLNSYRLVRKSEGSEMSYSMRVPINQRHRIENECIVYVERERGKGTF